MDSFEQLDTRLRIPDLWQQQALLLLESGKDVVAQAPTGAGKTYLVELVHERRRFSRIVLTVPTRALANDKLREWEEKGWRVGIVTGDITRNPDSPLVVATLETQLPLFLEGQGPALFVVDEYQLLSDKARGLSYEMAIASAPENTRLLLLSGSVSNPEQIVTWLRRIGRDGELVEQHERPVPIETIPLEALHFNPPPSVKGFWPRLLAKALMADLGPILVFAPRRALAEKMAKQLSGALPIENPLVLSPDQYRVAGRDLGKMLKKRIAYHHSGLSYAQRAGLIEPLAKAGQLRIVVSTTGLAAGVNFSMRSTLVAESEYQVESGSEVIRPDELLQMYGRAGRRGKDEIGYALIAPKGPRFRDARRLPVKRPKELDWATMIGVMDAAVNQQRNPYEAVSRAVERLFSDTRITVGSEYSLSKPDMPCGLMIDAERARHAQPTRTEMRDTVGKWFAQPEKRLIPAGKVIKRGEEGFLPALSDAAFADGIGSGRLARVKTKSGTQFGKRVTLGYSVKGKQGVFRPASWFRSAYGSGIKTTLDWSELKDLSRDRLSAAIGFGRFAGWTKLGKKLCGRIDLREETVEAYPLPNGKGILNPETRLVHPRECLECEQLSVCRDELSKRRSPILSWQQLHLIDREGKPTRRGKVFSFFRGGEGLAIAAALEDESYSVDAISIDVANLRAGFRFDEHSEFSFRLSRACRKAYSDRSYDGYLQHGLPLHYGEGAAEIIEEWSRSPASVKKKFSEMLKIGDLQRARLEWLSLLRRIAYAPDLKWERWNELKAAALARLDQEPVSDLLVQLPPLEPMQTTRVNHRLRFPRR